MPLPAVTSVTCRLRSRLSAVLVTLGISLVLVGTLPGTAARAVEPEPGPFVVVGVTGLRWDDVNAVSTPALWELSRHAAIGTLAARSVRSSACPADGWLALSAGARAADLPATTWGECRALADPEPGQTVPAWLDYLTAVDQERYDAHLGTLGEAVRSAGLAASSFGAGGAIALADRTGAVVGEHQPMPADPALLHDRLLPALTSSRLIVLDAGTVRDAGRPLAARSTGNLPTGVGVPSATASADDGLDQVLHDLLSSLDDVPSLTEAFGTEPRSEQVAVIEGRLVAVLAAMDEARAAGGAEPTLLLVSIADSGTRPRMQLAAALGPAVASGTPAYDGALLSSRSTRQTGIVQATDVAATIATALGLDSTTVDGAFVGSPITAAAEGGTAAGRLRAVLDIDRHAAAVRPVVGPFFIWLIVINLVLYTLVSIGLNGRFQEWLGALSRLVRGKRVTRRVAALADHPTGVLDGLRIAGVAVAAVPVSSLLANTVPWWRASRPGVALLGLIAAGVVVVTALALAPRWRRRPFGPPAVVATITAVVIAVDVATGARLQVSAPMGVQPLVAGRFYGFNNTAFALFAASALVVAAAVADALVRRGRRGVAAAAVGAIGLVAVVLDGAPGLGSDFGGPTALFTGFAILALIAGGVRLTWWRVTGVLLGGVAAVGSFAVADWLRPAGDRTHLGRFVQTVLDGGLWPVVQRKFGQNLDILFGSWLTLLAVGGALLVVFVLVRPLRWAAKAPDGGPFAWLSGGSSLGSIAIDLPMLRPLILALAVTLGIGFALNDSGVVIPAIGISVAVPLLVASCATWLELLRARTL